MDDLGNTPLFYAKSDSTAIKLLDHVRDFTSSLDHSRILTDHREPVLTSATRRASLRSATSSPRSSLTRIQFVFLFSFLSHPTLYIFRPCHATKLTSVSRTSIGRRSKSSASCTKGRRHCTASGPYCSPSCLRTTATPLPLSCSVSLPSTLEFACRE